MTATEEASERLARQVVAQNLEDLTVAFFKALSTQDRENNIFKLNTTRSFRYQPCETPPTFGIQALFQRAMDWHATMPHVQLVVREMTTIMLDEEAGLAEVLILVDTYGVEKDIKTQSMNVLSWVKQGWIWKAYKFHGVRMPIPGI